MRKRGSYQELTDPRNERVTGTLSAKAWKRLAVLDARARFYNPEISIGDVEHPLDNLIRVARQTSGSINGQHRKDLVEAIKGANLGALGLGVPVAKSGESTGSESKGL